MMKYFISYTTKDSVITFKLLETITNSLIKYGEVFIDLLHNNSQNKQFRVLEELDKSDMFILLETENVYNSVWVKLELSRAELNKIPIRKIKIQDLDDFITNLPQSLHSKN